MKNTKNIFNAYGVMIFLIILTLTTFVFGVFAVSITYALGCTNQAATGSVVGANATLFIPAGACPMKISFSSYSHQGTIKPFEDQILTDNITNTYGPGTYHLGPLVLSCNWQTDLYGGEVQTHLNKDYGTLNLIAYDFVEHQICTPPPATLHVIKNVINDNGGTVVASAFTLHVKLSSSDVAGSPAPGTGTPGTSYSLSAGTYVVSENVNASYASTFSGDCNSSGSVTLAAGDNKTCTITNNDIAVPPSLAVTCAVLPTAAQTGDTVTWSSTATGGNGTYAYAWSGDEGLTGTTASATKIYSATGTKNATIAVTSNGQTATASCQIPISSTPTPPPPLLDDDCTVTPNTGNIGDIFTWKVIPSGGTGVYTFVWSGDEGLSGTTASVTKTYGTAGVKNGTVNITSGSQNITRSCSTTVTTTPIPPPPICVTNCGSGPLVYPPIIHVTKVANPTILSVGPGSVTYTYTISNPGTVAMSNITINDNKCSPVNYISGDTNNDSKLDINETWQYNCTATISQNTTNTVVVTGYANGSTVTDTGSATVVVNVPGFPNTGPTPISIHLTKIPNPLKLPTSGGMVTYTYTATNPGSVALANIYITDDKCSPVNYISGDTNFDAKLDTTESWIFTCQAKINKTTTNTAVITGEASGLTVKDTAVANVVVPVLRFPNTGFSPFGGNGPWNIIIILGDTIVVLVALVVIFKKPVYE